jgi:ADP-ribosylglycohydrolase
MFYVATFNFCCFFFRHYFCEKYVWLALCFGLLCIAAKASILLIIGLGMQIIEGFMNKSMIFSKKMILTRLGGICLLFNTLLPATNMVIDYEQSFVGSMLAGALGDALGRVTEFVDSTDAIFKKYPTGVHIFADFKSTDWNKVPAALKNNGIAPYTDDTAMAKLVMKELIKARENNWSLNQAMDALANSFVEDSQDITWGWSAPFRSPGRACHAGVKELSQRLSAKKYAQLFPNWWDVEAKDAGGCGSVMRAHSFGLVFSDDPEKAALWAAEHSKLTHGHPIALASCAAMANGVAYAVQGKDSECIINKMISAACKYDVVTADKIAQAYEYGQKALILRAKHKTLFDAYKNSEFRVFNDKVFSTFPGWAAHDAIAATVYAFVLSSGNVMEAIYLGVHTPGDSDSIASMVGALVGAMVGAKELPADLIANLECSAELRNDAIKAAELVQGGLVERLVK